MTGADKIDARDLAHLHAACFTSPPPWSEASFHSILSQPGVSLQTDTRDGVLYGFALGRVILDEAELLTLATAPALRRQGVAAALLRCFDADVFRRGARTVFLEVAADNAAALALYRAAEFTQSARRKGYYAAPGGGATDALILRKTL
ncbi:ribosomal protein S18-alanine N-acetyltransferase [Roseicitreum antarcticum]|uniref:[Ribosomal protein bS18]-alanine N-acetyltransferase n=1 Tax=Roseicitreum antarcticum TaxID=564137 RepID=A0A1H2XBF4_9RHOB|nr:ribosomal protein S18-alanine N-acetyltransferase [Roseicitreum antarcticum]SDW90160.1 ribosomal-protein-alanine N-acetyltransferase [Roseicitreum antarcticum]